MQTDSFKDDDSKLVAECAKNILGHIKRNIVNHQDNAELINRMATMHKYIRVNFILCVANYPFYEFDDKHL